MKLNSKNIGLISGPLAFILVLLFFKPEGLTSEANAVLASTIWIAIWWITEAIPIAVTALIPISIIPINWRIRTILKQQPLLVINMFFFMWEDLLLQ